MLNSVNLFHTKAKELHSSLDLFGTLRKANELQQHGNSSLRELTSRRNAALLFYRELYSSLTLRRIQPLHVLFSCTCYFLLHVLFSLACIYEAQSP